jgi:TetR/AcrR family fatty acid metabolism transcriptional regulator
MYMMELTRSARTKEQIVKGFRTAEILEAARRVIASDGLADASMERIASEAGIAKGTIYLYFDSKETLLARAAEQVVSDLLRRTRGAVQRTRGVRRKLEQAVRVGLEHSAEHRLFLQALRKDGEPHERAPAEPAGEKLRAYLRLISGLIERGVRSGAFRAIDSRWTARCLVEMMRTARLDDPAVSAPDRESTADEIVALLLHGIGTGERR